MHITPADARACSLVSKRQWPGKTAANRAAMGLVLVLLAVLPVSAWLWGLHRTGAGARLQAEQQVLGQVQAMEWMADQTLAAGQTLARSLADSAAQLGETDIDGFRLALRAASQGFDGAAIRLTDPAGRVLASSHSGLVSGPGGVAPVTARPETASPDKPGNAAGEFPLDYAASTVSASVPRAASDRAPAGQTAQSIVTVEIPSRTLLAILDQARMPPGSVVSILDRAGRVVGQSGREVDPHEARLRPEVMQVVGTAAAGTPTLRQATLHGAPAMIAVARSPNTGYSTVAVVPEAGLPPSLSAPQWLVAVPLAAVPLLLALFLWHWTGTRSRRPNGLAPADGDASDELAALFGASPIGIFRADNAGRAHQANNTFLAMLGLSRTDLQAGRIHLPRLTPSTWARHDRSALANAARLGVSTPYEKEYRRPDGTTVPVLQAICAANDGQGIVGFAMDGQEQRRAAAISEAETLLRLSQGVGRIGTFRRNVSSDLVDCDAASRAIMGLLPEHGPLTEEDWLKTTLPEDRARLAAALRGTQDGCQGDVTRDVTCRFRIVHPDTGAVRHIEMRNACEYAADGALQRTVGAIMDVTKRHDVEQALRENQARFQRTVEAARIGTWDWNVAEDRIQISHHAGERMQRNAAAPPIRRSADFLALVHEQDREQLCREMRESIKPGGRDAYEVEFRVPSSSGGVRWLWTPGRVTARDTDGRAARLSGVVVDVTERRQAEEALLRLTANLEERVRDEVAAREEAQAQAAHAERMQALGRLAAGVAHDINNVLQTVSGAATMIERRPDNVESVRRLAQMSQDAAARGGSITGRLLAFGRRDVLRPEVLNPAILLTEMRDMLAHTLGFSLKVIAQLQDGLPPIMVDRGQLETVLVNLAANARDAMPNGGTLTLSASTSGDQVPMLLAAGEYLRIAVTDTGTGMDSATLARVTEPFYTTKPAGKGTGLGLAMAKSVVEQAGGVLLIDSREGHGTTVSLWLPRADMSSVRPLGNAPRAAQGRHRILLVDDDAMERETLAELLADSGLAVITAGGGNEALLLLEEGAEIDLIVTDLSMPDMDGITLIRQARVTHPDVAAILLTGYADHAGARALSGEGRFQLLRKPVEGARLVDQIEALLLAQE